MRFKFWNLIVFFFLFISLVNAQLFTIARGNKAGSCDNVIGSLNAQIEDGRALAAALKEAVDSVYTNVVAQKLVASWFKIKFHLMDTDKVEVIPEDKAAWERVVSYTTIMHDFWINNKPYPDMMDQPMIFCDASFAKLSSWTSPALDSNGNRIMYQGSPLTLEELYAIQKTYFSNPKPFWVDSEKGYFFAPSGADDKICDGVRTEAISLDGYRGPERIRFGTIPSNFMFQDILVLCPLLWDQDDGPARLSEMPYINPDTAEDTDILAILPNSATLFHELTHMTSSHITYDPFNSKIDPRGGSIVDNAYTPEANLALTKDKAVGNAETYVQFAIAWWYYRKDWGRTVIPVTFYGSIATHWTWPERTSF